MPLAPSILRFRPRRAAIVAAVLTCVLILGSAARTRSAAAEVAVTAPSAEEALAAFVQGGGDAFAGPCETTRSPEDIGKVCSRLVEQRDSLRAYLIGRTFSEFQRWVFIALLHEGWSVTGSEPLDFTDESGTIPWPR